MDKLREALRAAAPDPDATPEELRAGLNAGAARTPVPEQVTITPETVGGVEAERHVPPGDTGGRTLLYLHGGGYCMGSLLTTRALAANLALAAAAEVVALDYRLAPEHPFPAAQQDTLAAYDALLDAGVDPARLALGGDSAGGGLAVGTLVAARDSGRPLPAAAIGLSPWLDLALEGESVDANGPLDPMVSRAMLERFADWYAPELPRTDPRVSPARALLGGLPPLLLHVGQDECLRDDVSAFAGTAREAGVEVDLTVWPEMIHVWHLFAPRLPAANEAIGAVGDWLTKHWEA
jgi:epsilon-lactone hydrolase